MKLLFVLLACIAATNAAYCSYSYQYFYRHKFYVYPARNYYCHRVYFNNAWCSTKYYAPILKVYPGADCKEATWTETPVAELKTEIANLLAEALVKITEEMMTRRDQWLVGLDECHAEFKQSYADNLTRYYEYLISCVTDEAEKEKLRNERDQKIAEYNSELDKRREEALAQYNEAIAKNIKTIQDYHTSLCDNAEKCLVTRNEKIVEFENELYERVLKYLDNYWAYLVSVAKCRADHYRRALECVHGKEWMVGKIDQLMDEFVNKQCGDYKIGAYFNYYYKLYEYKAQMMKFYRCSYTCTFSTCALRFYKRSYFSSCKSLGNWYCYSKITFKTRSGIAPFRYCWRKASYKGLTKCDLATLHKSSDAYKTEFETLLSDHVSLIVNKFVTWKNKWIDYHIEYCDIYDGIMKQRHEWIVENLRAQYVCANNSEVLTPEQEAKIAELIEELKTKRETAVGEYKQKLLESILKCVDEFNASIIKYRESATTLITKIISSYTECLATRIVKIGEYRKSLEESRDKQRSALIKHMVDAKVAHFDCYVDLHKFYIGDELSDCANYLAGEYGYSLMYYCDDIVEEFDTCWATQLDQLVHHYSCNYRCRIGCFRLPTYCWGSYYSWRVSYPTSNCYTYYYKRYTTYCSYRVRYCRGYYTYGC